MADVQYSLLPVDHDPFGHSEEELQKYSGELAERQAAADADHVSMTHQEGHTLLDDPAVPFDAKVGALAMDTPRRMATGILGLPGDAYGLANSLRVGEPVTPEQAGQSLQIASGVMGAGTPFAEAGALGSSGGKLTGGGAPWSSKAKQHLLDTATKYEKSGSSADLNVADQLLDHAKFGDSFGYNSDASVQTHLGDAFDIHQKEKLELPGYYGAAAETPSVSTPSWTAAAGVPKETYGWHPDAFQHLEDLGIVHFNEGAKLPAGAQADEHYSKAQQLANIQLAGPNDWVVPPGHADYQYLVDQWSHAKDLHEAGTGAGASSVPSINMSEEKGPWNPSALEHLKQFLGNSGGSKTLADHMQGVEENGLTHPLNPTKPGYWMASDLLEEMKDKHSADIVKASGPSKPSIPTQFPAGASSVYSAPLSTRQVDLAKAIRPIENWSNYRPAEGNPMSFPASPITQGRALAQGYNTGLPLFKGMEKDMDSNAFWDPSSKPNERAIFASDQPHVANDYTGGGSGHNLAPMVARADRPFEVHWPDVAGDEGYNGHTMRAIIEHTRAQGGDALVIRNIRDLGGKQTQYAFMDPSKLRVRHAEFDPSQLASSNLLSSRGPAGLMLPQDDPRRKDVVLRPVDHDPFGGNQ